MSSTIHTTINLPEFISSRIAELEPRKSVAQIAVEAGLETEHMLRLISSGGAKLPLDHALSLASALECDLRTVAIASLSQFVDRGFVDCIALSVDNTLNVNDRNNVIATATAIAVELTGLKDDAASVTRALAAAEDSIFKVVEGLDRLVKESGVLAGSVSRV